MTPSSDTQDSSMEEAAKTYADTIWDTNHEWEVRYHKSAMLNFIAGWQASISREAENWKHEKINLESQIGSREKKINELEKALSEIVENKNSLFLMKIIAKHEKLVQQP